MDNESPNSVYVSYAWSVEALNCQVSALEAAFKEENITLQRDCNRIDLGDSIRAFMDELSTGKAIVVVISEDYLKSPNCMYELMAIHEKGDFLHRVFPIVLSGTNLKVDGIKVYLDYWVSQSAPKELKLKINERLEKLLKDISDIIVLRSLEDDKKIISVIKNSFESLNLLRRRKKQIESNIEDELSATWMKEYNSMFVKKVNLSCEGESTKIAAYLLSLEVKAGLRILRQTMGKFLKSKIDANETIANYKNVWATGLNILGNLVLLATNEKLIASGKYNFSQVHGERLELPNAKSCSIEIFSSFLTGVHAKFSICQKTGDIKGVSDFENQISEPGLTLSENVDEIKKIIWKILLPDYPVPPKIDSTFDNDINQTLNERKEDGEQFYFSLPINDATHPINKKAVYEALFKDIPNLFIFFLKDNDSVKCMCIDDGELIALIREYLKLEKKYFK